MKQLIRSFAVTGFMLWVLALLIVPVVADDLNLEAVPGTSMKVCLGGTLVDRGYSIHETSDGGFILTGETSSNDGDVSGNHGGGDVWVVKLNSAGLPLWQRCLGGTLGDKGYSIHETSDGGFILTGETSSNDGDVSGNHGTSDIWVVKLKSGGGIQWQKCLGGTLGDKGYSIHETSDGGFILTGQTWSNDGDVSGYHGGLDVWVVKLKSGGGIQWQKCLGGTGSDYGQNIHETSDGGFILTGYTYSTDGDVSGNHGNGDVWVVRLSEDGMFQWQRCLGGTLNDWGFSIHETSDGGFILTGETSSNDGDVSGNHGGGDVWVVKLNSAGLPLWQRCFGGTLGDKGYSIHETSDGGYVITGLTFSTDGDVSGNHGTSDIWVVKLNSGGFPLWQKCLGGSGSESGESIHQTNDGGFILTGFTSSADGDVSGNHGGGDVWVVKLYGPLSISSVKPVTLARGKTTTVTITGKNFRSPALFRFEKPGFPYMKIVPTSIRPKKVIGTVKIPKKVTRGYMDLFVQTTDDLQYARKANAVKVVNPA